MTREEQQAAEQEVIRHLQLECPKLEIVSAYARTGWRLIGYRPKSENGNQGDYTARIVEVKGVYLKPTCQKFRDAYYKAEAAGLTR
jgi:hypothetical protein